MLAIRCYNGPTPSLGRWKQQGRTLPLPPSQQQMVVGVSQMSHVGPGLGDPSMLSMLPSPPPQTGVPVDGATGGGMSMVGPPNMYVNFWLVYSTFYAFFWLTYRFPAFNPTHRDHFYFCSSKCPRGPR